MLSKYKSNVINILLAGFVLSAGLFFVSLSWHKSFAEAEFKHQASVYVELIKNEFIHIDAVVNNNRSFIEFGLNNIKRADGADLMPTVKASLFNFDGLVLFSWIPFPSALKPAEMERVLHIKKGAGVDATKKVMSRSENYFDRLIKMINPKILMQSFIVDDVDIDVVDVIFDQQQVPYAANTKGIGYPRGFLLTRWSVEKVIEHALLGISAGGLDFTFARVRSDSDRFDVYTHISRSHGASEQSGYDSVFHYSSAVFEFAGEDWQLSFKDAPYFLNSRPYILPWVLLGFGLFFSIVFAMRTHHLNRQYGLIKEEVKQRTQALRLSEKKLKYSNDRYSTLVEMSHVGIVVLVEGRIRYANSYAAEKLGLAEGDDMLMYVAIDDRDSFQRHLIVMREGGQLYLNTNDRYLLESGSVMYGESSSRVIEYEGEQSVLILIRDVTEQHLINAKLQHMDRIDSLGVLAGGIAHDFNNLLSAAMGSVSLLEEYIELDSPGRKHLDTIHSASKVAAELCSQMLAYSGKGEFVLQALDLSHCIKGMRSLLHASIPKDIKLDDQLQAVPAIMADMTQIHQLILNLIINAVESMSDTAVSPSGKQLIRVRTGVKEIESYHSFKGYIGSDSFECGEFVYLEISDCGCGISDEVRKRMFDPYFSTKGAGRGLGMSAMLGILKGHKGGMRINSSVGQGTDISVIFPAKAKPLKVDAIEREKSKESDLPLRSGLVLIVDDELIVRKTASLMLAKLGFDVITSNDGVEGVEAFKQNREKITFVLLDVMMPNMGGAECFSELRKLQSDLCIIMSSGYSEESIDVPMDCFLKKPYSLEGLREAVDSVL